MSPVHLKEILQFIHQTVGLKRIQFAMPFNKGNAGDLIQGKAVNGPGKLILQGLNGIVQVHLVGKGWIIFQKIYRHFIAPV